MSPISTVVALFVLTNLLFHACARSGTATFYTPPYQHKNQASACNGYKDDGVMIAAASSALWNHGRACGKLLHVRCVGATNNGAPHPCRRDGAMVTVRIVDFCPPGCRGTIDLSEEAFAEIADPSAGKIKISY